MDQDHRYQKYLVWLKRLLRGNFVQKMEVCYPQVNRIIDRGVPLEYYKIIISVVFNKNFSSFKAVYERAKNQTSFQQALPLFGLDSNEVNEAIFMPFLNDRGSLVLSQLLHLFRKKKGELFYNCYLGHLTALLLVFFEDYQAYQLVTAMMDHSSNMPQSRLDSLSWHLVFRQDQMKSLALSFFANISQTSRKINVINKHLIKNNIDRVALFNAITENFYYGYLPFPLILKILLIFLNEGVKTFYRVFYIMLASCQVQILKLNTLQKILTTLRRKWLCMGTQEGQAALKQSYNLSLSTTDRHKLLESRLNFNEQKQYYLPVIEGSSSILTFEDLQTIWKFLPVQLKNYDMQQRYPAPNEPLFIEQLIKALSHSKFNLIVIKSQEDAVFGCFIMGKAILHQQPHWYGSHQNFVFTLHPTPVKYASTRQNQLFMYTSHRQLRVGGDGSGNALFLDEILVTGQSYESFTFRNQPLNQGQPGKFKIKQIEAFSLY